MFKKNDNHGQSKGQATHVAIPDLSEFDQDLEVYSLDQTEYGDNPSPADGSIPSFGVTKPGNRSNQAQTRPKPNQIISGGPVNKKKQAQAAEGKDTKRAIRSKRVPTRQDNRWRFFFGLGLFVTGLAGSILLVQSNTKGIEVIIATRDIAAGQSVTNADFATARMSVPPDLAALLVNSGQMSSLTDAGSNDNSKSSVKVATRKLRVHEPIMQGDVASPTTLNKTGVPEGMVAMALPVSAATAASRITPGDTVNLLYVNSKGSPVDNASGSGTTPTVKSDPGTSLLAEKVTVLDVVRSSSGVGLGSSSNNSSNGSDSLTASSNRGTITNLTLLLTLQQAQKLAVAKENGTVNVVLLPFQVQLEKPGDNPSQSGTTTLNTPVPQSTPVITIQPTVTNTPAH